MRSYGQPHPTDNHQDPPRHQHITGDIRLWNLIESFRPGSRAFWSAVAESAATPLWHHSSGSLGIETLLSATIASCASPGVYTTFVTSATSPCASTRSSPGFGCRLTSTVT